MPMTPRDEAFKAYKEVLDSDWAGRYPWDLREGESQEDPRTVALDAALAAYDRARLGRRET